MAKQHHFHRFPAGAALAATLTLFAGAALAQPNLVSQLNNPMTASVGVQNTGDTESGPSHLTINCTKFGKLDGGCPEAPGLGAYVDPAFPNRVVIDVPALAPGETFNHDLSFWGSIPWTPGTYVFDAVADAGNDVAESNEANNTTQSSYTQQPMAGVAPPAPLPLKASTLPTHPLPGRKIHLNPVKQLTIGPGARPEPPARRQSQRLAPAKPVEPKRLILRAPAN